MWVHGNGYGGALAYFEPLGYARFTQWNRGVYTIEIIRIVSSAY